MLQPWNFPYDSSTLYTFSLQPWNWYMYFFRIYSPMLYYPLSFFLQTDSIDCCECVSLPTTLSRLPVPINFYTCHVFAQTHIRTIFSLNSKFLLIIIFSSLSAPVLLLPSFKVVSIKRNHPESWFLHIMVFIWIFYSPMTVHRFFRGMCYFS